MAVLSRLHPDAPWVRIGWIEPEVIDAAAPLRIDPEPDVLIRVYVELTSLDAPQAVPPPTLPPVPPRRGLVVVEWGDLER